MLTSTFSTTAHNLRCDLITEFNQLEELSGSWDRLWRADPAREIFQSFEWAQAWWQAYGHECSLHCLAIYDDQTLIGILPLVQREDELQFLGAPQADYTDVLCEEDRALEVLAKAFSVLYDLKQWKECKLEHLPSHSRIVRHWRNLPDSLRRYSSLVFGCYCHTILVPDDSPDLLAEIARKRKMREHANKLAKLGIITFRFLDTKHEAREHLPRFFRYHVRRWALIGETSDCNLPTFKRLLEGLVNVFDLKNELRFSTIEVNGSPVAYQLGFDTAGKYTLYQQTFDVDLWNQYPGNVLLRHMFLYAGARGVREFDFTVGAESYKTRFTNSVKRDLTLYLERPTVWGLVRSYGRTVQGSLYHEAAKAKTRLQKYPNIFDPLNALWKSVRDRARAYLSNRSLMFSIPRKGWSVLGHARRSIWQTQDRVLSRIEVKRSVEHLGTTHKNPVVVPSRLSDIADLVLENCNLPGNLEIWSERMARGDELIVIRENEKAILALWTTSDPTAVLPPSMKYDANFDTSRIVYEQWSSDDHDISESYCAALAYLVQEAEENRHTLWVCSSSGDQIEKRELSRHGFYPRYCVRDRRIFHFLRLYSIKPIKGGMGHLVFSSPSSEETVGCTTKTN